MRSDAVELTPDAARALEDVLPPLLVVDDDAVSRMLATTYFQKMGLRNPVVALEDGEVAVDYLKEAVAGTKTIPALVLLDLHMPRLPGLEVLTWIRLEPALDDCKVVLLTGSAEIHEVEAAKDLQVSSYLVKPIGFRALSEVVRRIDQPWALLRKAGPG